MKLTRSRFEDIVLTPQEKRLFFRFESGQKVSISRENANTILRFGLIEPHFERAGSNRLPWDGTYVISDAGQHYLQYLKEERHTKQVEWTRYIITTAIAIAAFVKSFFF